MLFKSYARIIVKDITNKRCLKWYLLDFINVKIDIAIRFNQFQMSWNDD